MESNINKYMLQLKCMIVLPEEEGIEQITEAEAGTIVSNLIGIGYIPSKRLLNKLKIIHRNEAIKIYETIHSTINEMLGYEYYLPMYPNFPEQVMNISDLELLTNALVHYYTSGKYSPFYNILKRKKYNKYDKPKEIKLGTKEDIYTYGINLMKSKTSLSQIQKDALKTIIEEDYIKLEDIPDEVEFKEIKTFVLGILIKKYGVVHTKSVKEEMDTATDVLRLVVALSDGDISLAEATKIKSFKRAERRLIMNLLNNIIDKSGYDLFIEDINRYREYWKRVGERLHPGEFKHYENVKEAFKLIRSNEAIKTFNSKVDALLKNEKYLEATNFLSNRPGELARKIDFLIRKSNENEQMEILKVFKNISENVSTPVLLQLKSHLENRLDDKREKRLFLPKGNEAKAFLVSNELEKIDSKVLNNLIKICRNSLINQYSKREKMGKVYIDAILKNYNVPFSKRSSSQLLKTLVRGSKINLDDNYDILRAFIWWRNGEERTDLDLSVLMLKENFERHSHVSYTNLKSEDNLVIHSGDIVDAPSGACEFIDFNITKLLEANSKIRYAIFSVFNYTKQAFDEIPECFMGWMKREGLGQEGEIYDARTVENKINITGSCNCNIPFLVDLKEKTITWLDLSTKRDLYYNNIESNQNGIVDVVKSIITTKKPNIYDLIEMNVESRGKIVYNKEEADKVFSLNEGITPFDDEMIISEYI